ncbi:MAG: transcription-repair coupling factor [Dehalococcoidia bacterium]
MNLYGILPLLSDTGRWTEFTRKLGTRQERITLIDGAKPFLLACLRHSLSTPVLVITPDTERAKTLQEEITAWSYLDTTVHLFPEIDVLPYERLTPDAQTVQSRLRVLSALSTDENSYPVVVAPAHAASQKTISPADFAASCKVIKQGTNIEPDRLMDYCTAAGYEAGELVEVQGRASKRGGIVDIYSPNNDWPARIDFFGNQVESIRWFDPATQRSLETTESLTIVPAREVLPPRPQDVEQAFGALDLSGCTEETQETFERDRELLLNGQWPDGFQFYVPFFNHSILVDYFPQGSLIVLDDLGNISAELSDLASQAATLRDGQIERGELPKNFPSPCFEWNEIEQRTEDVGSRLALEKWSDENTAGFDFRHPPEYAGRLEDFIEDTRDRLRSGERIMIVSRQANRLAELFKEKDIFVTPREKVDQVPQPGTLALVHGSLSGGWVFDGTSLFTDAELFGFVKKRRYFPVRRTQREAFLADLSVGDYVVHTDHGIARFSGMMRLSSDGTESEYLVLEYSEGDRLYVPSTQADRVTRYIGPGGHTPSLSRLHTGEWARTKQRVKKAAEEVARELLDIYASREVSPGISFSPDTVWQQELEASFPYVETPDQRETIQDVKVDMENQRPMDRLVCGDVGYGKTEVAVRAAFKAISDGKQVAVLVPTTVLAQQHLATFKERLAAFPVIIEVLSRFRAPKEQQEVLEKLRDGSVDICIGTHRLLQKDVFFNNLGLVIVDEEQKFGVSHKEQLKKLRGEVDVLTLSATPIPRTLHMSLVGVRDMSTMETAPEERLPIKTYVTEYSEELVRAAILRELDRSGQVFFVHNRVQSIGFVANELRELVPEARIAIGHGQMPEEDLESVMADFTGGEVDVLVCTTIIESGLDLPNVNTLIVNHADKFGLTQLYHLRGRVGRGDVRAYAYFLYEKGKRLTDPAQKRLKTIFETTELGSGFRIAMKDLEIRGAGNILSSEQSGHMGAVGFDLYCRLLAQAVDELKRGEKKEPPKVTQPTVDLPLTAHIPEDYMPNLMSRLALYQRLAGVQSREQIQGIRQETEDRFGKLPSSFQNLLYVIEIKLLASEAGIQKVSTEGKYIVLRPAEGNQIDYEPLQRTFGASIRAHPRFVRLNPNQLGDHWTDMLREVLQRMANSA